MPEIIADNISVINSNALEGATRLDAEYYQPKYLKVKKTLNQFKPLKFYTENIIHPHEIKRIYSNNGETFLLTQNVRPLRLDFSTEVFIGEQDVQKLFRNVLKVGDVLITRTGANFGDTAFYYSQRRRIFASSHVLIVRPITSIDGLYLAVFLNTKWGRKMLDRGMYGGLQPEIAPSYLRTIPIPRFEPIFEKDISQKVIESLKYESLSNSLYFQAEAVLLEELCLKEIDLSHEPCYEVSSAETISANRIDTEYYLPKYSKLFSIIQKNAKYCRQVREFQNFNARGSQPIYAREGSLKVINSKHILEQHLDYENFERTDEQKWNLQSEARVFKYDILTYTTGAYVGRTNVYFENDKALASNHVNILRLREENPIYVSVVLNSMIGRLQTRRLVTGSAQVELYPGDIDKFIIPFIDIKKQEQISNLVEESYRARREAKALLEEAKKKVEEIIEKGQDD